MRSLCVAESTTPGLWFGEAQGTMPLLCLWVRPNVQRSRPQFTRISDERCHVAIDPGVGDLIQPGPVASPPDGQKFPPKSANGNGWLWCQITR